MSKSDIGPVNDSGDGPVDAVREDSALLPEEKQFSIVGTKADDRLTVYTEVARGLLTHAESEVTRTRRVDGVIVGVEAKIPCSLLSIKAVPRNDESWHAIVSSGGDRA